MNKVSPTIYYLFTVVKTKADTTTFSDLLLWIQGQNKSFIFLKHTVHHSCNTATNDWKLALILLETKAARAQNDHHTALQQKQSRNKWAICYFWESFAAGSWVPSTYQHTNEWRLKVCLFLPEGWTPERFCHCALYPIHHLHENSWNSTTSTTVDTREHNWIQLRRVLNLTSFNSNTQIIGFLSKNSLVPLSVCTLINRFLYKGSKQPTTRMN